MEKAMSVAIYMADRYMKENGQAIDEMKLHKLMYFAQRESYIQTGFPLFDATFYGWKYGPIIKEIRSAYRDGNILTATTNVVVEPNTINIVDKVFKDYAQKSSWSLSRLTHGELSWKNSRNGIAPEDNSDVPMREEDIKADAKRIKDRRQMLAELGLA